MKRRMQLGWTLLLLLATGSFAALELPNASLEEDFENDGIPDKWKVPETTRVTLVTDQKSHGAKAAKFTAGYVLLSTNMQSEKPLPGQTLRLSFDACGAEGAKLGVMLGYYAKTDGEKEDKKFRYSRMTWNRTLRENYVTQQFKYTFPEKAVESRVWLAVYRSNKKGIVWLDNFTLATGTVTPEQRAKLVLLQREWGYLKSRLETTRKRFPENPSLGKIAADVQGILARCANDDTTLLLPESVLAKKLGQNNATINKFCGGGNDLSVWFSDAYARLAPDETLPAAPLKTTALHSLRREYRAVGINIANGTDKSQTLNLTIKGLGQAAEQIQWRKQVFLKTWYRKGKTRIADPLPLLKDNQLPLAPGATAKLFLSFRIKEDAKGEYPVTIRIADQSLTLKLDVLDSTLPSEPRMHHFQFIYPNLEPANEHPELTAKDLADHYCDGIEFPFLPEIVFNRDGSVKHSDFPASKQTRWMKAYAAENIKLGIFWEGIYKKFPLSETEFLPFTDANEVFHPAWKQAYANLLRDWLDFSRGQGHDLNDFLILPDDEPSSQDEFQNAPGRLVRRAVDTYKLTRNIEPGLKQLVTISDYANPGDIQAILPHVDIVMPVWPARTSLTRWAPKDYNPRQTFHDIIVPQFKKEREKRGLQIWSYAVDRGKTEPVLNSGRAYPLCAVGLGYTGVATWAYNVTRGSSWDDTDKGMLDYSFIYNGKEDHPINMRENPTGEIIVPSIRWEAMRMGIQDAQILLALQQAAKQGNCDAETATEIKAILTETETFGHKLDFSFEKINRISTKIRKLILKVK